MTAPLTVAPRGALTVEHVPTRRRTADYYRVSAGPKGGQPVTVRVGFHGRFACLSCLTADECIHARAAQEFAKGRKQEAAA